MKLDSPAKINLFLYIISKREDGFHNLLSLMTEISLCDEIEFDFSRKNISVECEHPDVPEDESNLAFKAAKIFFNGLSSCRAKKINKGIKIKIKKRIPPGGGLGGGSSNAACVLKALNKWNNHPFSNSELMTMGLQLGADVPFFIRGGHALAQGTGEDLTPCNIYLPYYILLVYPGFNSSTSAVYKNVDLSLTKNIKFNSNDLIDFCKSDRRMEIEKYFHNDLEFSACGIYPRLKSIKNKMADFLHESIFMTGSGSSFFVLFSDYSKAEDAFRRVSRQWKQLGMKSGRRIFLTMFRK